MDNKNIPLKEGYVSDYISDQPVKATPEELQAVQIFSKALVEDYDYPKNRIQVHPQFRVKVRPSDIHKDYPVDITVFDSDTKNDDTLYIVVECKKKNRKDGMSQLKDYLRFSKAYLGVWFNGEERVFLKKFETNGSILFEEIPNIPKFGQRVEDIGLFKRNQLKKSSDLKTIFRALRNHLAGNTVGTTRDEVLAQQLINLIFCKIYDERFTKPDEIVSFRAGIDESETKIKQRVVDLFEKVKSKYKEVIDFSDKIALDAKSVRYIVGELQNYCLTDSDRDAIADAFETFIAGALKGGQGQFFTPRNVVKVMVEIIDPKSDELIIDPACGSGGFLVEALRHVWNKLDDEGKNYGWSESALKEEKIASAIHNIRGIEKDEFLSKVTKAYMAIIGDGKGGIFCEDSLDEPKNWAQKTQQNVELGKFDVLLTNPPFGKDIKIVGESKLMQFDLAYQWKLKNNEFTKTNKLNEEKNPQILFIERSLQLLRDGGRMGIVLPETFFHAPNMKFVMRYMTLNNNVTWLVDLPHNTFRPHNNAKCVVIILEKNKPQQEIINMAVAEEMGHDHQGKSIYRWDYKNSKVNKKEIWDDIEVIIKEIKDKKNQKYTFKVDQEIIKEKEIYVPRYYWQSKQKEIENIAKTKNLSLISLSKLIQEKIISNFDGHGSPPSENKGMGEIPYIRVKDIVNWEIYKDPTAKIPVDVFNEMSKENKKLNVGDIVYVRRGSYRIGSVAMISPHDLKVLLTRELLVLRVIKENNPYDISPYYLLYLLSHKLTQMQTLNKVLIETTLPNIANRWMEVMLPISNDKNHRKEISKKVEEVFKNKWLAVNSIEKLKTDFGDLIT